MAKAKYEYVVMTTPTANLENKLNSLAVFEWEPVSIYPVPDNRIRTTIVLKREKVEESNG